MMFKAVALKNMFLYCNTRGPDAKPIKELSELGVVFKTLGMNAPLHPFLLPTDRLLICRFGGLVVPLSGINNVQYLLQPVSGSMRLAVNKEVRPPPRVKVDAQIDALHIQLGEDQFQRVLQLVSVLTTSRERMGMELEKFQVAFKPGSEPERKKYSGLYKVRFIMTVQSASNQRRITSHWTCLHVVMMICSAYAECVVVTRTLCG